LFLLFALLCHIFYKPIKKNMKKSNKSKLMLAIAMSFVCHSMQASWLSDKINQFTTWVSDIQSSANNFKQVVVCNEKMTGPESVCINSGNSYEYTFEKTSFQTITWTVPEFAKIKSINGLNIDDVEAQYRQVRGLPVGFPVNITTLYVNDQKVLIGYQGQISQEVVLTSNVNASVQGTFNGQTVTLQGVQFDANANLYSQTKYKGDISISIPDLTGGKKGGSINPNSALGKKY
jgi:hypothetical protein